VKHLPIIMWRFRWVCQGAFRVLLSDSVTMLDIAYHSNCIVMVLDII